MHFLNGSMRSKPIICRTPGASAKYGLETIAPVQQDAQKRSVCHQRHWPGADTRSRLRESPEPVPVEDSTTAPSIWKPWALLSTRQSPKSHLLPPPCPKQTNPQKWELTWGWRFHLGIMSPLIWGTLTRQTHRRQSRKAVIPPIVGWVGWSGSGKLLFIGYRV